MYKNSTAAVNALRLKLRVCDVLLADRHNDGRLAAEHKLVHIRARTQAALETLSAAEATRYQLEAMQ